MGDSEDEPAESRVVNFRNNAARGAGYFGLSADGVQNLVDFRLRDGRRTAFSYSNLRFLDYDHADDIISLEFGPFMVTIDGEGLNVIYEGLVEGRVRWLREILDGEDEELVEGVRIDAITLIPPQISTIIVERVNEPGD